MKTESKQVIIGALAASFGLLVIVIGSLILVRLDHLETQQRQESSAIVEIEGALTDVTTTTAPEDTTSTTTTQTTSRDQLNVYYMQSRLSVIEVLLKDYKKDIDEIREIQDTVGNLATAQQNLLIEYANLLVEKEMLIRAINDRQ